MVDPVAEADVTSVESERASPVHPWLRPPPWLARVGIALIHAGAGLLVIWSVEEVWTNRNLLRLLVDFIPLVGAIPAMWFLVLATVTLIALVAATEVGKTLWRWRKRQPERVVALRIRAFVYTVVGSLVVIVLLLNTSEFFSGPFRLRFPFLAGIFASYAYGAYVLWTALLPRLQRAFSYRLRRGLDILCMNAVLLLVLGEISIRTAARFSSAPILVTDSSSPEIRRESQRLSPGSVRFSFPVNQGGHYDTEFVSGPEAPDPLVVSIGDSFSYGTVPHAYHFTTVAELEYPGIEIYNMGYPGTGPADYLYMLESQALPLEPDLVVIQLFVGNDVTTGPLQVEPRRWYDAESYLLATVWHRLQILRRAERADLPLFSDQPTLDPGELSLLYPWLSDPLIETASFSPEVYFDLEARNAREIAIPRLGGYEFFLQTLAEIERAAGDVPLAYVLIPDEFQVDDTVWNEVVARSEEPLERDLAQRTIVEWMESQGMPVLDLLPILRAVEPLADGRPHLYHLRDTHFNARGNAVAGQALGLFVSSLLSVESGSPTTANLQTTVPTPQDELSFPSESTPPLSAAEAVEIYVAYGAMLGQGVVDGNTVLDTSLLPHSKDRITASILLLMAITTNQDEHDSLRNALMILAFFQPDVGESGIALDSMGPNQMTWQDYVATEMTATATALTERGY